MEITACPNCGSKNIGIGTLGDGIIFGLSSWKEVCRDCGYQGASLVFDSESEYQKFLDALRNQKEQQQLKTTDEREGHSQQKADEQTKEQGDRVEHVNETDAARGPGKKRYLFELLLSIVLSVVLSVILFGSNYFGEQLPLFPQDVVFLFVLYLFGSFVGFVIFFFLLIVLLETAYRSILRQKK